MTIKEYYAKYIDKTPDEIKVYVDEEGNKFVAEFKEGYLLKISTPNNNRHEIKFFLSLLND